MRRARVELVMGYPNHSGHDESGWPEADIVRPDGSVVEGSDAESVARELNVLWSMVWYLASAPEDLLKLGQAECIARARAWAEEAEK